ncbi:MULTISPECIES: hypothetical protein [unclassified Streptomyces]|uniref:hypothetical protein n=1 Tax=unclassified Streptomyces TaxID=2593676 RepID=UPI00044D619B|nr:hypothetical protein [Streptomyces sp. PCS3-D2]WKV70927.1 hypothetical protein AW27_004980 [Streptomyces sp. PCS3-D2]
MAAEEISALEELAAKTARGQRSWAVWWRFVETWAGLTVAVLSALAGVSVLASQQHQGPAAVLALASSALGAVLGFSRPADQARKAETLALLCEGFARRARQARTLTLPDLDAEDSRRLLSALTERWETIRWDDLQDQLDRHGPQGP